MIKLVLSYLFGSVSGSMLMGKLKGIDIREMGSGNAGGTNAFRTMGTSFALGVLFIDVFKGFIAVNFLPFLKLADILTTNTLNIEILQILCSIGVVLGHVYPVFHEFKGGKGAGTMVGVLAAIFPTSLFICFAIWLIILIITGFVGFSTIIAGIALPICTHLIYPNGIYSTFGFFSVIVAIFIIYTHRKNIIRMMAGKENRFEKVMIFSKKRI